MMKRSYQYLLVLFFFTTSFSANAQQVKDIYKKSLKEVLDNIEKSYNIRIKYDENIIRDKEVTYATWRFTSDVKKTLENVLTPLDLSYTDLGNNNYQVSEYEYYRRSEQEGKKHLDELLTLYSNAEEFSSRKAGLRECISTVLGISLNKKRSPLNPIFQSKKLMNGYSVENVAFESFPGYYVTGTLYRPLKTKGPVPVILCPHGHFYNETDRSIANDSGRYNPDMQYRCASLAKMGAIVLNFDMYSYGESAMQSGSHTFHETSFSPSIQTWNSLRAVDFLLSLPGADKNRVGVTGASGGGTQTILVSALDDRVTATVPVVMVSSSFYGGCACESGLPIHDCGKYKTNNAEIAAMTAPRPQLIISEVCDWTISVPGTDFPYLKKVYALYGKEGNVDNVHLADKHHDYGITKRVPMYKFFTKVFGLNIKAITDVNGNIDEKAVTIQDHSDMLAFGKDHILPASALRTHAEIMKAFALEQQKGISQ